MSREGRLGFHTLCMDARSGLLATLLIVTGCSGSILGGLEAQPFERGDGPTAPGAMPSQPGTPTSPGNPTMPGEPVTPTPTEPLPPIFDCQPGAVPTASAALRLTKRQYRATVSDLLSRALPAASVEAFLSQGDVAQALAAMPDDGSSDRQLVYDTQDQRISTRLIEPQLDVATAIGTWLAADATRLGTFVRTFGSASACGTVTASACVDSFILGFGERALRRPLDVAAGDVSFYRAAYDDATYGGYRGLVAALLLSPGFVFRLELAGAPESGRVDVTRLTPFELASRLSYTLTGSMPDEALFTAARAGFVGAGNTVDEQVDRLLSTSRARAHFEGFYRQWLRVNRVSGINPSAASALALQDPDGLSAPLPSTLDLPRFRLDAFEEQVSMMTHFTFDEARGSMRDVLTTNRSFARSAAVASVYGVGPWSGDPAQVVSIPEGQRAGLFTRSAFLLSGYPDTNPIHRGARLQVEYLCGVMEPPADTSPPAGYMPPAVPTVRNVVAAKTEMQGTACYGCHKFAINPLGFALEQYDAFGRNRRQEPIHDGMGGITRWERVDFTATTTVHREGPTTSTNGVEFSAALARSDRFHACYARNVFRAFVGRGEQPTQGDACTLAALQQASAEGSLKDVARALVRSPAFSLRRFTPDP